jgi:hypothetical protein
MYYWSKSKAPEETEHQTGGVGRRAKRVAVGEEVDSQWETRSATVFSHPGMWENSISQSKAVCK